MHRLAMILFLIAPSQTVRVPLKDLQPVVEDVPASEVKKIEGNCEIHLTIAKETESLVYAMGCHIYNGSDDWTMETETTLITVHDRKGTDVLSRRYNITAHIPPLTTSETETDLGIKLEEGQTWSVSFIAAKGYH